MKQYEHIKHTLMRSRMIRGMKLLPMVLDANTISLRSRRVLEEKLM